MELNSPLDIVKCSQTISVQVMEGGAAYNDGRISVGDRLVAVKKLPTGDFYLDNCTHEESVQVTGGRAAGSLVYRVERTNGFLLKTSVTDPFF